MSEIKNPDPLLNTKEAARYIGKSPKTLRKWKSNKRYNLSVIKIGRSIHYRQSELDRFLDQSTIEIRPD